jgi:hypothetical protein
VDRVQLPVNLYYPSYLYYAVMLSMYATFLPFVALQALLSCVMCYDGLMSHRQPYTMSMHKGVTLLVVMPLNHVLTGLITIAAMYTPPNIIIIIIMWFDVSSCHDTNSVIVIPHV